MNIGLNYEGKGYKATIHCPSEGDDTGDIILDIKKTLDGAIMTIKQDRDIIALSKDDIIALHKYLVQVSTTL